MQLVSLEAYNFKKLRNVTVTPTGIVTNIIGKNEAGKSSILDAIVAVLDGASASPRMPIRKGSTKAEVIVDLGDIVVRRRWSASGTVLEITDRKGVVQKGPQGILDKLVGRLMLDPLAFSRMKPAEQARTLAGLTGIDLAAHAKETKRLAEAKTEANRNVKNAKATLERTPVIEGAPDAEVSVETLMQRARSGRDHNRAIDAIDARILEIDRHDEQTLRTVAKYEADIAELSRKIEEERTIMERRKSERVIKSNELAAAQRIDVDAIEKEIAESAAVNSKVRAKKARAEAEAAMKKASAALRTADDDCERLASKFTETIANSKLPISGLLFDEEGVTYKGVPFEECSTAESIRVSAEIGFALEPKLKLMLIYDGSLLDSDSYAIIADLAEEHGAQVLIERIQRDDKEAGILIVDGEVVQRELAEATADEPKALAGKEGE